MFMYKFHHPSTPSSQAPPSEWVVLRGDLMHEVISNNGHLAEDVFPDLGDLAEEEQREDSGGDAEAGEDRAVAVGFRHGEPH